MNSVKVREACKKHENLVDLYFENNGKRLCTMIDKILFKLKFDAERSDFYSLGSEIFLDALCRYDETQDFNGFLYSCLVNKFKTEMTKRNRQKRKADKDAISIDTPVGDEDSSSTLGDVIADKSTIEKEIFDNREEGYSKEMRNYLSRLSNLQREVLRLISIGFMPSEILEELHINQKMYEDCYNAIHSYKNISILM